MGLTSNGMSYTGRPSVFRKPEVVVMMKPVPGTCYERRGEGGRGPVVDGGAIDCSQQAALGRNQYLI